MPKPKKLPKVVYKKLGRQRAWGYYDRNKIQVDPRAKGKLALDVLIHEGLHHFFPDHEEAAIDERARGLAELLWREGYRRSVTRRGGGGRGRIPERSGH